MSGNYMKTYISIFAATALFTLAACGGAPEKENPQSFILAGRIVNIPEGGSRTMIINECDISPARARLVVEFDSAGRFQSTVPLSFGHTFSVNYSRQFVEAYAEPGDSIYIEIDASTSPFRFKLSGSHEELNNAFGHASADVISLACDGELPSDTMAFEEYMPIFRAETARRMAAVEGYLEEHQIPSEAVPLLRAHALYSIANNAVGYKGRGEEDAYAFFTDSIFDINNEENLKTMMFPYHLSAFAYNFPDSVALMPKGRIRDLMYASRAEDVKPAREAFADTCYFDRIFGTKTPVIELGDIAPSDIVIFDGDTVSSVEDVDPIKWLIAEYGGRLVYLDVSAVWCGPCRQGIQNGAAARKAFKDTDVVFAIIWLRSDFERWKEYVPTVADAVHIYVGDEDTSNMLMGKLGMAGFPSYYLIDKKGEIRNDAPHFANPDLVEYLKAALKE